MSYYMFGDFHAANSDLKKALQLNPSEEHAVGMLKSMRNEAVKLCNEAKLILKSGNLSEGLRMLNRALEICPDETEIVWMRGLAYAQKGDSTSAARDIRRVLQLDPSHSEANELLKALGMS